MKNKKIYFHLNFTILFELNQIDRSNKKLIELSFKNNFKSIKLKIIHTNQIN